MNIYLPHGKSRGSGVFGNAASAEHTITSEEDYRHHIDYVYINPLKHGLITQVKDWPYSSFHRDVKNGLYPQDWASVTVADTKRKPKGPD